MIAGIAFAINEQFDKILLALVASNIAEAEVGVYSACYKLGLFMVLYRIYTGIEPFLAMQIARMRHKLRHDNKVFCDF
jgi:O-antigen/teichoic acid export membrane protein